MRCRKGLWDAHLQHFVCVSCGHSLQFVSFLDASVLDQNHAYDSPEVVRLCIKEKQPERCIDITCRWRHSLNDRLENLIDSQTRFRGCADCRSFWKVKRSLHVRGCAFWIRCWEIHFVQDWNDCKILIKCEVEICNRLSLQSGGLI